MKTEHCFIYYDGFNGSKEILNRIGKYKSGRSCFYINKLEDIDSEVLKERIQTSVSYIINRKNSI